MPVKASNPSTTTTKTKTAGAKKSKKSSSSSSSSNKSQKNENESDSSKENKEIVVSNLEQPPNKQTVVVDVVELKKEKLVENNAVDVGLTESTTSLASSKSKSSKSSKTSSSNPKSIRSASSKTNLNGLKLEPHQQQALLSSIMATAELSTIEVCDTISCTAMSTTTINDQKGETKTLTTIKSEAIVNKKIAKGARANSKSQLSNGQHASNTTESTESTTTTTTNGQPLRKTRSKIMNGKKSSDAADEASKPPKKTKSKKEKLAATLDSSFSRSFTNFFVNKKITDYFQIRKSTRKCASDLEKEKRKQIEDAIKNATEEGLVVKHVENKGRGVFAGRDFKRGDFVCEYAGEMVSYQEAKRREQEYGKDESIGCYMYFFEHKSKIHCIDATAESKRLGRLLNHSKLEGNCQTKLFEIDSKPYLILVAARDIMAGEELTYDYGDRNKVSLESHPWLAQ